MRSTPNQIWVVCCSRTKRLSREPQHLSADEARQARIHQRTLSRRNRGVMPKRCPVHVQRPKFRIDPAPVRSGPGGLVRSRGRSSRD